MLDFIYILIVILFFVATCGLLEICSRLMEN